MITIVCKLLLLAIAMYCLFRMLSAETGGQRLIFMLIGILCCVTAVFILPEPLNIGTLLDHIEKTIHTQTD